MPITLCPPIKVAQLEAELSYADSGARESLISGLKSGFHIGISHFPSLSLECRNLLSARSDPSTVTSLLKEELGNGYLIGPYNSPPFDTFPINPLGLAQRKFSNKKTPLQSTCPPLTILKTIAVWMIQSTKPTSRFTMWS